MCLKEKQLNMLTMIPEIILLTRRSLKVYAKDCQWDVNRSVVCNFERSSCLN